LIVSTCGACGDGGGGISDSSPEPTDDASNSGAAYVFQRDVFGFWSQQAYVKASNTGAEDLFGWSVALSGDTLAVAAPFEDGDATGINGDQSRDGAEDSGAVYVLARRGSGPWSQEAYLKASNSDPDDRFGWSIALSGDTLAVGSRREASAATGVDGDESDNNAPGAGAVYVFTRDGSGLWSQQAYIKASNTGAYDGFGGSIALSGDTLVVGAEGEDGAARGIDGDQADNSAQEAGAVYVFTRDGAGVWSQQAYIKASNTEAEPGGEFAEAGDLFGDSVAFSGDTLAVGAPNEDSGATGINGDQSNAGGFDSGAVYVFARNGAGVWSQQAYIKASNTDYEDLFGISVALSGDTLAVGAFGEDSAATGIDGDQGNNSAFNDDYHSGAVYVFTRDGAGAWSQQAYVKASNTDNNDDFGYSVALSGDTLTVGARSEESAASGINGDESDNSASGAGAAYVFTRDGAGVWSQQAYVKASNTDPRDSFGLQVSLSGDTLAVGAQGEDSAAIGVSGNQGNNIAAAAAAVTVVAGMPTRGAIDRNGSDVFPVTVLGSPSFDATQLDITTIQFGPAKASPVYAGRVDDVNDDGIVDMLLYFDVQDTGIICSDIDAALSGATFGGDAIAGAVSAETLGCR
jgi:hypothetical protein